jgi:1-acyl-sn-glycerol-3-phosphate acyltransferase
MIGAHLLADGTGALLRTLGVRIHVHGAEQLPQRAPAVIASNHVSYVDFAAIQAARPNGWAPLRFLARWDLVPPWLGGPVMRRLGLIPVDERRRPGSSFPEALRALALGEALGIHPEGRVHPGPGPRRGRGGAVRLAAAADVPLVPCSVWGTQRLLTRGRRTPDLRGGVDVHVRFGPPVDTTGHVAVATRRLMAAIGALTAITRDIVEEPRDAASRREALRIR